MTMEMNPWDRENEKFTPLIIESCHEIPTAVYCMGGVTTQKCSNKNGNLAPAAEQFYKIRMEEIRSLKMFSMGAN